MKPDAVEPLTPIQRAAVLLMTLGEHQAAEVLKHMGAREVQKLGTAMATISNVSRDQVDEVMDQFIEALDGKTALGVGNDDYVRKVLVHALGEEKAGGLIDRILFGRNTKGLETLKWMEPRAISDLIRNEHPQIIAIVLSYLDSDQAAAVLKELPERVQSEAMLRIATLDGIPPNALDELNEILERQFAGNQNIKSSSVSGVKVAAAILNFLDRPIEERVMKVIADADAKLGAKIQDLMFVFDDLLDIDDRSMQTVLREIPNDRLSLALRGADGKVKDKILSNMSQRAAQMLNEDMEARGPVRLADVESAQKDILAIVRRMADDGTIQMGSKAEALV
jgi:flagellar motor switch protein FliG